MTPTGTQAVTAAVVRFPVTVLASGQELDLTAHVVRGPRPGPVVSLVSGLHGDELFTAAFFRHVLARLAAEREQLRGQVVLVPMANPPGFEWGTRNTPHDQTNLNRVFPGSPHGTLTELLANVLVERVIQGSDLVLDYHAEPDALSIRCTYARTAESPYGRRVLEAALASGSPVVYAAPRHRGMLAGYAEELGIPAFTPELGGPLPDQPEHLEYGWTELRNVLRHVGALPGAPERPARQWLLGEVAHVRPRTGGLFYPEVGFAALSTVQSGETVLGRVISPYTLSELEVLRGPFAENLLMAVRGRVSKVHPGDPAYIVGNAATAEVVGSAPGDGRVSDLLRPAAPTASGPEQRPARGAPGEEERG